MNHCLITFASVHHALRARQVLAQAGIRAELLPIPRDIELSCGQCLRVAAALRDDALTQLRRCGVSWTGVYRPRGPRLYEQISCGED